MEKDLLLFLMIMIILIIGVIQRISISKSATDPAVYTAAIEFQVGTDVTVE